MGNFFFLSVYFVLKRRENEFLNLHKFDPGGGGGLLSSSKIEPKNTLYEEVVVGACHVPAPQSEQSLA